ncbi:AGE family epimerase/isomerase [Vibrio sp. NTOU-M3]|uniref:AGE family epimerase/isomerase n=1 Tax=Vibrio sp. NTOU-M3 TaxID=3234954 RepID=UPI00349F5A44
MNSLSFQAARCQRWLTSYALPKWQNSVLKEHALFAEGIRQDGELYAPSLIRFRVQPRQIYVFSHATLLDMCDATELVNDVVTIGLYYYGSPEQGFKFALSKEFDEGPSQIYLYEQAFALLGFAWHYKLTRSQDSLNNMYAMYDFIERELSSDRQPGFYISTESLNAKGQNPHMHLFEALMVAYEATDDAIWLQRAGNIYQLFNMYFLRDDHLAEFFNADLSLDKETGTHVDPGHHYEWIWLLNHYQKLTNADVTEQIEKLQRFAQIYGHNPNQLVRDEVLSTGEALRPTSRLWCQTEYLKACIALWERNPTPIREAAISSAVDHIFKYYIEPAEKGLWVDQTDKYGFSQQPHSPASTFYHIFLAFAELIKAEKELSHGS